MNKNTLLKIVLASALASALLGGGIASYYYWYDSGVAQTNATIVDFDEKRDMSPVLEMFEKDRYWLVSSADYDPYYAFSTRSPNKYEEKYKGKMVIKILRKNNEFIGLVTYYMENFMTGRILFLAVKPEFRGQRFGPQLMEYAIKELKKMGAQVVQLVTRTSNLKAQAVYNRVGFKEIGRDADYVYFAKQI